MFRSGVDHTTIALGLDILVAIQFNFNFNDIHIHDQWVAFTDEFERSLFNSLSLILKYSYLVSIMPLTSMVFNKSTIQEFYT